MYMYRNLRAEIVRAGLTIKEIAMRIGISERSLRNKINGKTEFTLSEAIKIRKIVNKNMSLEELFESVLKSA